MNDKPVSVLMSVYNEPLDYIMSSVDSVLEQSYTELQIIIVIDNPDNTAAANWLSEKAEKDSRILLLKNEKNMGLVYSLNRAIANAAGDYFARMDADDISDKDRIIKEMRFLEENGLDLVASNVTDIDENGMTMGTGHFPSDDKSIKEYLKYDVCMPHPTWFGKRSVFEALNGYRSIDACEDYDFLVRGALKGYKYGVLPEPALFYRINSKGISQTKRAKQKTTLFYLKKCYRINRSPSLARLSKFMDGEKGRKKYDDLAEYYRMSARLKELRPNKAKYLCYGGFMFIKSAEARTVISNMVREKIISKRAPKKG